MVFEMRLRTDGRAYAICKEHADMNPVAALNVMQSKKDIKRPRKRALRIKVLNLIATCPVCSMSQTWELENAIFSIQKE